MGSNSTTTITTDELSTHQMQQECDDEKDVVLDDAERVAQACLEQIQRCIDVLRTIPEFSWTHQAKQKLGATPTRIRNNTNSNSENQQLQQSPPTPPVFSILSAAAPFQKTVAGLHSQSDLLLRETNRRCSAAAASRSVEPTPDEKEEYSYRMAVSSVLVSSAVPEDCGGLSQRQDNTVEGGTQKTTAPDESNNDSERSRLVAFILLPLLNALSRCYQVLDDDHAKMPAAINTNNPTGANNRNDTAATSTSDIYRKKKNTNQRPPPPPIGLLSLKNYTDVACFVEWTLCTSSLFCSIPPNVVPSVPDRVRHSLPRALAGRIPALALLWATSTAVHSNQPQKQQFHDSSCCCCCNRPPLSSSSSTIPPLNDYCYTPASSTRAIIQELHAVVSVVGHLLLLDRFRPMLLPRHLPDLLAAHLWREELLHQHRQQRQHHIDTCPIHGSAIAASSAIVTSKEYKWVVSCLTGGQSKPISHPTHHNNERPALVDPHWLAQSYQTLLRMGRDAPNWLRVAISSKLSTMATTNLAPIVTVFVVQAASQQDRAAAAYRLAMALAIPPTKTTETVLHSIDDSNEQQKPQQQSSNEEYFAALCQQLVDTVDSIPFNNQRDALMIENASLNAENLAIASPQHMASMQVVWAVLDQLPEKVLNAQFHSAIFQTKENLGRFGSGIPQTIRRFSLLLTNLPASSASVSKLCRLILMPFVLPVPSSLECYRKDEFSEIDSPPITYLGAIVRLATTPSILKSVLKDNATLSLRLFARAMMRTKFRVGGKTDGKKGCDEASGAVVLALALLNATAPCHWDEDGIFFEYHCSECEEYIEQISLRRENLRAPEDMEKVVEGIQRRMQWVVAHSFCTEDRGTDQLLSLMFRALLMIYFCTDESSPIENMGFSIPSILHDAMFQLVALVGLPIVCDSCPPEALLCPEQDTAIFEIMRVVFGNAIDQCLSVELNDMDRVSNQRATPIQFEFTKRLASASQLLFMCNGDATRWKGFVGAFSENAAERSMSLSVTSLLLSMLVMILELGARQRSSNDEAMLHSFSCQLKALSSLSPSLNCDNDEKTIVGHVAEMASYAAALLASRHAPVDNSGTDGQQDQDSVLVEISKAEADLESLHPPLRARGMVLLRKLANSIGQSKTQSRPPSGDLWCILRLAVRALADIESYVYLAGIHTIVAVIETIPSIFIPTVGLAITRGILALKGDDIHLSLEQRAKLSESLVFVVRRSGPFDADMICLFDLLVFEAKPGQFGQGGDHALSIQAQTHAFFVDGSDNIQTSNERKFETFDDYWEAVNVRVRTGGPLFANEETDLVRAAMMSTVSELLSVLSPTISARFSVILIICSLSTLRLEASRPVRRAGATLARELYAALLREQEEVLKASSDHSAVDAPMAVAMVKGREDVLFTFLQRIVDRNDEHDLANTRRISDPATEARCLEALELRKDAYLGGVLAVGKAIIENSRQDDGAIARLLKASRVSTTNVRIEEI